MKDDFESQLDEIRIELYEKNKNISNAEAVRVANANGKRIAEKYGITVHKGVH